MPTCWKLTGIRAAALAPECGFQPVFELAVRVVIDLLDDIGIRPGWRHVVALRALLCQQFQRVIAERLGWPEAQRRWGLRGGAIGAKQGGGVEGRGELQEVTTVKAHGTGILAGESNSATATARDEQGIPA